MVDSHQCTPGTTATSSTDSARARRRLASLRWEGMLLLVYYAIFAAALILGDLSARVNGSPDAGRLTTWLVLLYPPLAAFTGYLWPEMTHLLLFSAALWVLVARRDERVRRLQLEVEGTTRTVDNYIHALRRKLEEDPSRPRHIITVRQVGYRLDC